MRFSDIKFRSRFLAAPMAGFSDYAWRAIASRFGAGAVYSEMISVEGIVRGKAKTLRYLDNAPSVEPFFIQVFGGKPEAFERVFESVHKYRFDGIDINMGCPVKKVVSRNGGCTLMRDPKTAEAIILALRKEYKGPLSVKIRSGWDDNSINAVEIAKLAEGAGADAIIVHPRTRAQGYSGLSDWKVIAEVKKAVKIPVIGNGDVHSKGSADKMFSETNCDLIMIGRAALANPFVFREAAGHEPATVAEKFQMVRDFILLMTEREQERYTVNAIKKFVPKMFKGFREIKTFAQKVYHAKKAQEVLDSLEGFEDLQRLGDGNTDNVGETPLY